MVLGLKALAFMRKKGSKDPIAERAKRRHAETIRARKAGITANERARLNAFIANLKKEKAKKNAATRKAQQAAEKKAKAAAIKAEKALKKMLEKSKTGNMNVEEIKKTRRRAQAAAAAATRASRRVRGLAPEMVPGANGSASRRKAASAAVNEENAPAIGTAGNNGWGGEAAAAEAASANAAAAANAADAAAAAAHNAANAARAAVAYSMRRENSPLANRRIVRPNGPAPEGMYPLSVREQLNRAFGL